MSDGTIGDAAHMARDSDHDPESPPPPGNPDDQVDAGDFTHDPGNGADMNKVSEAIRKSKDRRVSYIIWNRHITGPSHNWQWDPYDGVDPHTGHMHVSVNDVHHDETQDWSIGVSLMDDKDFAALAFRVEAITHMRDVVIGGPLKGESVDVVKAIKDIQAKLAAAGGTVPDLSGAFTLSGTITGTGKVS